MAFKSKASFFFGLMYLFLLFPDISIGQSPNDDRYQFTSKEWNFGLAYFGEFLLRPGFSLSADYPMQIWTKEKQKKKGNKYRSLALHLGGRYWNYYQKKAHTGNALDLEVFIRRTRAYDYKNKIGIFDFGVSAGLGWNRLHGGVYATTDDGFKMTNRRQAFFSSGFFVSFGGNMKNRRNIPMHWYVKPKIVVETPYAPFPQVHPSLETGISLPLSFFQNIIK